MTGVTMLTTQEIARFRDNLDCHLKDCDWHEDKDGAAWCEVCGSGFLPSARGFLKRLYERTGPPRARTPVDAA